MSALRVLALTRYGAWGASSRVRFMQYLPTLRAAGLDVQTSALFDDAALRSRYAQGRYATSDLLRSFGNRVAALRGRNRFDLLWIEKECLPWMPLSLERALLQGVPYVLDYDDAIFHNYDHHRLALVRGLLGRRLDGLMARASLVIGGNRYLVARAREAGAPNVALVPTTVDLAQYPLAPAEDAVGRSDANTVVWIGSPTTVHYLEALVEPLRQLATRCSFTLRVIGATANLPGVKVEHVSWSAASEARSIAECAIGIMPLFDSPWERGKCGYKLVQYMACGLPVVASPVGVNAEIVEEGVNGYLADEAAQWVDALESLLRQPQLRASLGATGRRRVETTYSVQVTGPQIATLLRRAATPGV